MYFLLILFCVFDFLILVIIDLDFVTQLEEIWVGTVFVIFSEHQIATTMG